MTMHVSFKHYIYILILAIVWGSSFTAVKISVDEFTPVQIAFVRVLIAGLIVFAFALFAEFKLPMQLKNWGILLLIALFSNVLPFSLIGWASTISDSSTISILMATSPIFALVLAHFFTTDDRLSWFKVLSVMIGFSGVLILFLSSLSLLHTSNLLAKLAALLAAVSYVVAGLLTRKLTEDLGVPSITSIVLGFSALSLAPIAFSEGFSTIQSYSVETLVSVLYLGVFSTALSLVIRYSLILEVGYTFVSYTGFLIPVFAIIFGALLLNEELNLNTFIALLLVLLALAISRLSTQKIKLSLDSIKLLSAEHKLNKTSQRSGGRK